MSIIMKNLLPYILHHQGQFIKQKPTMKMPVVEDYMNNKTLEHPEIRYSLDKISYQDHLRYLPVYMASDELVQAFPDGSEIINGREYILIQEMRRSGYSRMTVAHLNPFYVQDKYTASFQ